MAVAAQTWGLSTTASVGKAAPTATSTSSTTSSAAAKTTAPSVRVSVIKSAATVNATANASRGLSAGAKAEKWFRRCVGRYDVCCGAVVLCNVGAREGEGWVKDS